MLAISLRCVGCGAEFALERAIRCAKCGMILDVLFDYTRIQQQFDKGSLSNRIHSLWRYREILPMSRDDCVISLGEGMTPLKRSARYTESIRIRNLFLKLDYLNPTGSFKDRGSTVSVSKMKELRVRGAEDDSSGNAASSLAAYCGAAGIKCTVYVPAKAPRKKIIQAEMHGAKVVKIRGSRTSVTEAAEKNRRTSTTYHASHNTNPFFLEGIKTLAYEISENFDWQVPDHVVLPVGGGALFVGTWKGFEELVRLG